MRITTCLTLAAMHEGGTIVTIERLGTRGALPTMQATFIKHDGFQCALELIPSFGQSLIDNRGLTQRVRAESASFPPIENIAECAVP